MDFFELDVTAPLEYAMTGKFKSPDPNWIHLSRILHDYELVVVTEGVLYIINDDVKYCLSKGEYLLMPPETNQIGYQPSDCSFYWLHFTVPERCTGTADEDSRLLIRMPRRGMIDNFEKVVVIMKQLQDCVRSYNNRIQNNYLTTVILCELSNQTSTEKRSVSHEANQKQICNDILDYVKMFIHSNIKVSEIASHFGYNSKYISLLFKNNMGITLKQYILTQKMEIAKFILTDTNNTVREIALQLGFSDSHNFMKEFKKVVGLTPSEYRNAYSKRLLFYE